MKLTLWTNGNNKIFTKIEESLAGLWWDIRKKNISKRDLWIHGTLKQDHRHKKEHFGKDEPVFPCYLSIS